jgi:hypothetical protein
MAFKLEATSDITGANQPILGSDGRLNVSSRADPRSYYNSRDEKQAYSSVFEMTSAESGEYVAYLQNTSLTGKELVIEEIGINADQDAKIKLWFVHDTAAGGELTTMTNLNHSSSNSATAISMQGGSAATGITGLGQHGVIDLAYVKAGGHEEFRLKDRLRLGQNDAIAIQYVAGTAGDVGGVIFGYFE